MLIWFIRLIYCIILGYFSYVSSFRMFNIVKSHNTYVVPRFRITMYTSPIPSCTLMCNPHVTPNPQALLSHYSHTPHIKHPPTHIHTPPSINLSLQAPSPMSHVLHPSYHGCIYPHPITWITLTWHSMFSRILNQANHGTSSLSSHLPNHTHHHSYVTLALTWHIILHTITLI